MPLRRVSVGVVLAALVATAPLRAALPVVPGAHPQRLPGVLRVNGVPIEVQRFEGAAVTALVQATQRDWGGVAQRQGSWWQLARVRDAQSEVLQWRQGPAGHEALYSRLRLAAAVPAARRLDLDLPSTCSDARHLELGEATDPVLHLTARCNGSVTALRQAVARAATRAGWQPAAVTDTTSHWARPGWQLQLQWLPTAQGIALLALQWRARGQS